ncbi:MAG: electron transport complex subunit E [Thiothrix sp.]|jgi:electron transport complex protein RnfE|nr:MAG: electron transport complex subunit E [Thiothrix sp.]
MSAAHPYREIAVNGLWHNNPGLVQLLGLCPLLAVTTNAINGLGLGIATLMTLAITNLLISLLRAFIREEIRIPAFVLIIASTVTAIELLIHAYFSELYAVLGIFIPLIVTNCIIIGRAEAYAAKHPPQYAGLDGLMMGLGFTLVLIALGAMREFLAQGTILSQAHLMFGEAARGLTLHLSADFKGLLLAALPPGAFISLGFLVAGKNYIDQRRAARIQQQALLKPASDVA